MTNINEFVTEWQYHRKVLLQMLETISTEQLNFKPWEKAMSVSELVLHMAGAMDMFANTVKNGAFTRGEPMKACDSAEELRTYVAARTEQTEALLLSLTEEQLGRSIEAFGRTIRGSALLREAKEHEIHHKGQLFVYLRLAGIENLPFFVNRS